MTAPISDIDDNTFLDATEGGFTVVDFWATWCGPCRQFAPLFEAMATKHGERVRFARCDVDQSPSTAAMVGIMSIPTVVVFDPDGNELTRISGTAHPRDVQQLMVEVEEFATQGASQA